MHDVTNIFDLKKLYVNLQKTEYDYDTNCGNISRLFIYIHFSIWGE